MLCTTLKFHLFSFLAHVNELPTLCFRLNVFRLKKLNKRNFSDIGLVIQSNNHVNGKSRMITIIKPSQKNDVGILFKLFICAQIFKSK